MNFIITILASIQLTWASTPKLCHYQTWDWDTNEGRSVHHRSIVKPYSDLSPEEKGSILGCSLCEEDQVEITLPSIPRFKVCKIYQKEIEKLIQKVKGEGFPLTSIIGYRVGKTLGPKDKEGRRTKYSNHSYGLAIDFNAEINGMYNNCIAFNSNCRLIHGGSYSPQRLGSVHPQTSLYKEMSRLGFKWGGELIGRQKDFMHFSKESL